MKARTADTRLAELVSIQLGVEPSTVRAERKYDARARTLTTTIFAGDAGEVTARARFDNDLKLYELAISRGSSLHGEIYRTSVETILPDPGHRYSRSRLVQLHENQVDRCFRYRPDMCQDIFEWARRSDA